MTELPLTATKLLLATLAFVVIGWLGARDKRIGGVLLTFPLLNGIAMLTGADPLGIAATIYLVVMWNCALFLIAMYTYDYLPPLPARWDQEAKLIARVVLGGLVDRGSNCAGFVSRWSVVRWLATAAAIHRRRA